MKNNIQPNIQPENYSGNNQITPPHPKTNPLVIISLILLILLISVGSFVLGKYFTENKSQPVIPPTPIIVQQPTAFPTTDPTAKWKEYKSIVGNFSLRYPATWLSEEYKTGVNQKTGSRNVTFAIDPQKVISQAEMDQVDLIPGMITVRSEEGGRSDYVIGYNSFKDALIGYGDKIKAKIYERKTGSNEPNPSVNNRHIITYYFDFVNGSMQISYGASISNDDKYLTTFDQILSTFRFLEEEKTTPIPTTNKIQKLNYNLPAGWQTIKDENNAFEVGFDPNNQTTSLTYTKGMISLFNKGVIGGAFFSVGLYDYDGGSRHNFIFKIIGQPQTKGDDPSQYKEVEYLYNGKSCLFLENIFISQIDHILGMCDAGNGKAFLITSRTQNYQQTLQTLRFIK